jgi:hypothetical protein
MSKKSQTQNGNAHVIIIILLVIALLGLLGFVFWQNYSNKKTVSPLTTSQTIPLKTATERSFETNLNLKYPSSWNVTHATSGDLNSSTASQSDTTNITSPDGATVVTLIANRNTQNTGVCTDEFTQQLVISQMQTSDIPFYSRAQFVSYVIHRTDSDTYSYYAGMNSSINTILPSNACSGEGRFMEVQSDNPVQVNVSITKKDLVSPDSGYTLASSVDGINSFLGSSDFKTARTIVESLSTQ